MPDTFEICPFCQCAPTAAMAALPAARLLSKKKTCTQTLYDLFQSLKNDKKYSEQLSDMLRIFEEGKQAIESAKAVAEVENIERTFSRRLSGLVFQIDLEDLRSWPYTDWECEGVTSNSIVIVTNRRKVQRLRKEYHDPDRGPSYYSYPLRTLNCKRLELPEGLSLIDGPFSGHSSIGELIVRGNCSELYLDSESHIGVLKIPATLKKAKIPATLVSSLLPNGLTSLVVYGNPKSFAPLPKTLVEFTIVVPEASDGKELLGFSPAIPPNVKTLSIEAYSATTVPLLDLCLPNGLEELRIHQAKIVHPIELPPSVRRLDIHDSHPTFLCTMRSYLGLSIAGFECSASFRITDKGGIDPNKMKELFIGPEDPVPNFSNKFSALKAITFLREVPSDHYFGCPDFSLDLLHFKTHSEKYRVFGSPKVLAIGDYVPPLNREAENAIISVPSIRDFLAISDYEDCENECENISLLVGGEKVTGSIEAPASALEPILSKLSGLQRIKLLPDRDENKLRMDFYSVEWMNKKKNLSELEFGEGFTRLDFINDSSDGLFMENIKVLFLPSSLEEIDFHVDGWEDDRWKTIFPGLETLVINSSRCDIIGRNPGFALWLGCNKSLRKVFINASKSSFFVGDYKGTEKRLLESVEKSGTALYFAKEE